MGGARLYRSQTARVNAPVRPLIASGPQFLHVRDAGPGPVRIGFGPFRSLCRPTVRHTAVDTGTEKLKEYYSKTGGPVETQYALAAMLDPSQKLGIFASPEWGRS